jgi:hypothetical protein
MFLQAIGRIARVSAATAAATAFASASASPAHATPAHAALARPVASAGGFKAAYQRGQASPLPHSGVPSGWALEETLDGLPVRRQAWLRRPHRPGHSRRHRRLLTHSGENQVRNPLHSARSAWLSPAFQTVWTWRSAPDPTATPPPGWLCTLSSHRCVVQPMMTLNYISTGCRCEAAVRRARR